MAKIEELKKYLTHEFSSGSYTGADYKVFQTKYINYLKAMCRENYWQLVNIGRNHYCFSAFIKSAENKCVYISIAGFWSACLWSEFRTMLLTIISSKHSNAA